MSVHPKCQRQKCKSGAAHERRKGECKSIVEQKPQTQTQAEYAKFRFRLEISNLTGPRDSWNRAYNLRLTKRISRRLKELMHQALGPIDIDMVPCTVASWSKMTFLAFKKAKRFHISNLPYLAGLSMICSMMVCRSMMQSSFYGSWMPNDASASCVISSVLALRNIEASQQHRCLPQASGAASDCKELPRTKKSAACAAVGGHSLANDIHCTRCPSGDSYP